MLLVSLVGCVRRVLTAALTNREPPQRERSRTRTLPSAGALLRIGLVFTLIGFALTLVSMRTHAHPHVAARVSSSECSKSSPEAYTLREYFHL